ncbi:hypothetical protein L6452_37506 [Arctium lappa]|uniref:Uncharacterized protein n=1 Tax=Arctium lappa TaxID=4217 RepID=A0ACB8Y2I6_ARCLA|nr:hypothetical protein L6452_37506 [Arctium lappa]
MPVERNQKQKTPDTSGVRIVTRSTQKAPTITDPKGSKAKGEDKKIPKVVRIKMKGKQPVIPNANSDSDFEDPRVHPYQGPTDRTKASMNKKRRKRRNNTGMW